MVQLTLLGANRGDFGRLIFIRYRAADVAPTIEQRGGSLCGLFISMLCRWLSYAPVKTKTESDSGCHAGAQMKIKLETLEYRVAEELSIVPLKCGNRHPLRFVFSPIGARKTEES